MCKCKVDKFKSEGNKYMKKLINFKCKCKDDHVLLILFCENHPYVYIQVLEERKCLCTSVSANNICNFCIHVKYLLNFKCYKLCLKRIPVNIQDKFITTCEYFKTMKGSDPFFILIGNKHDFYSVR